MNINQFREKANIWLYGNKDAVLRIFRFLNIVISILAIITLVIYYGYQHGPEREAQIFMIIKGSFAFYVLYYLVRFVYDFHPLEYLKRSWFEGFLMLILVVEGISYNFFDTLVLETIFSGWGFDSVPDVTIVLIQLYFFAVVLIELSKTTAVLPQFKVHPSFIFIGSFTGLSLVGTLLLKMPEMTLQPISWLDAAFSSTSATCVTGLMTVDTAAMFSFKGQVVILILMQLGGLNIVAFGSFLALAAKFGVNIKQHDVLEDFLHKDSYLSARGMLTKILTWTLMIEAVGVIGIYLSCLEGMPFKSEGDKIFSAVFHSVSAFNNAGISTFPNGMVNEYITSNYFYQWMIIILIWFGSTGIMTVFDLFDPKALRERMRYRWKQISFSSKIALYYGTVILLVGAGFYYWLEITQTSKDISVFGGVTEAVFQSINTRSSGFSSVDIGTLGAPMLLLSIILMFIGSASGSTGGGIKTSTFAVILADVLATIRGRNNIELFKRTIPNILKSRAYAILMYFIFANLIGLFLLCITEYELLAKDGGYILDLAYEQASAVSTVGLSMGVTPLLSPAGKIIIMSSMLLGRVGALTVAFAVSGTLISKNYKYPEGHTMVG